jgi:hypothetical protein
VPCSTVIVRPDRRDGAPSANDLVTLPLVTLSPGPLPNPVRIASRGASRNREIAKSRGEKNRPDGAIEARDRGEKKPRRPSASTVPYPTSSSSSSCSTGTSAVDVRDARHLGITKAN